MLKKGDVKYGDIIWMQFDPSVGHEFQDKRPALVIQSDEQLAKSNLVTVMPLTSNLNNMMTDDILLEADGGNNLRSNSAIKVFYISSYDYQRIFGTIGKCGKQVLNDVRKYLNIHFGI